MTQAERRASTRRRLLEAAAEAVAGRGVQAVTIEEISSAAGLSRGAFYAHFPDKAALIVGLLDKMQDDLDAFTREIATSGVSPAELFAKVAGTAVGHSRAPASWILLFGEFRLQAIRDPKLRPKLARYYRRVRTAVASVIEQQFAAVGSPLIAPAEDLASVVIAIDEGLAAQRQVDSRAVPKDLLVPMLDILLRASTSIGATKAVTEVQQPS